MDINISKKYSCIEINMKTKISICIPTYEMNGKGVEYLNHSFNILSNQSYQNFDVVVSDNSKSSAIESLCYQWKSKLDIKHFYNHENDYRLLIWKLGCDQVSFIFMYRNHVIFSV